MKKLVLLLLLLFSFKGMKCITAAPAPLAASSYTRDPARTPKEPGVAGPVYTVDGSTGKYRNKHKVINGKNFVHHKRHIKTAKPHNGKEKGSKRKDTETSPSKG